MKKHKHTLAERMIKFAEGFLFPRGELIIDSGNHSEEERSLAIARIQLAVAFYRRSPKFKLRAIIERWNNRRVVREMY